MAWQWVSDLLARNTEKKAYWDARCPYALCPSNESFYSIEQKKYVDVRKKARLKFVQKISPLVYQYRCKDCGCLNNISVAAPDDGHHNIKNINPALRSGKASYRFDV